MHRLHLNKNAIGLISFITIGYKDSCMQIECNGVLTMSHVYFAIHFDRNSVRRFCLTALYGIKGSLYLLMFFVSFKKYSVKFFLWSNNVCTQKRGVFYLFTPPPNPEESSREDKPS